MKEVIYELEYEKIDEVIINSDKVQFIFFERDLSDGFEQVVAISCERQLIGDVKIDDIYCLNQLWDRFHYGFCGSFIETAKVEFEI